VQALIGNDITIYGDGRQTRSFCYVDDLIDIMHKVMSSGDNFTGPINIGNPEEFAIIDLAQIILEMTKSQSKIVYKPMPSDDPMQRKPNIDLASNKFNWYPKVNIEKGLEKTIKYFRGKL
jgi:UDP-glucuronate decarboxylase